MTNGKQQPLFTDTTQEERMDAWQARRAEADRVRREEQEREYQRRWALPRYAVAKLGPTRWYWYVIPNWDWFYQDDDRIPTAEGYAATEAEALTAATTEAGQDAIRDANKFASARHREKVARQRAERMAANPSTETTTGTIDYVWAYIYPYEDRDGRWERHQVIKRSKTRLYVAQDYERATLHDSGRDQAIVIDRATFERDGYARPGRRHLLIADGFYREPYERDRWIVQPMPPPWALTVLELESPCTLAEVESAYRRLARLHHPDTGGDAEAFLEVRRGYEIAKAVFARYGNAA